jgi:signal peptidase I
VKLLKQKFKLINRKLNTKNGTGIMFVPFFLMGMLLLCFTSFAQTQSAKPNDKLIQLSGVVVEGDSLKGVPFTSIVVGKTNHGAVTDYDGFFTLIAKPGDVIEFVNLGYKDAQYIVPDTLTATHFSIVQIIHHDTFTLQEVAVYPWPSKEDFKTAFLKRNVANTDLDRAKQNLAAEQMRELVRGVSMDAYGNYRYAMQQQYNKMYYMGQYPPNNLLNPLAWAQFIKALKAGKLKIQ